MINAVRHVYFARKQMHVVFIEQNIKLKIFFVIRPTLQNKSNQLIKTIIKPCSLPIPLISMLTC